jgi:hypothetical protein
VAAQKILAEFAYQNVRVSIDNDEWQFNSHHLDELEKSDLKVTVTSSDRSIARTQERTCHFWSPDIRLAGRDVKYILLIQIKRINADHLLVLLSWYRSTGWEFTR